MARCLTIFDLDHTLISCNCSFKFGIHLYRRKNFKAKEMLQFLGYYLRHKFFGLPMVDLHQIIFQRLFIGKSMDTIAKHVDCFLEESLDGLLYGPAKRRFEEARHRGDHIILLSSSPQFLVGPIAKRLKFDEWASTNYAVNHSRHFSSISSYMLGEDKGAYVKEIAARLGIPREKITAFTDSVLDLPLLEAVGNPIAVRPDRRLRKICRKNRWQILDE